MRNKKPILIFWLLCVFVSSNAQFAGSNLAEYQLGNIPGRDPQYINSIYDQLNVEYRLKQFRTSLRLENYYSDDSLRGEYTKVTQFSFSYRNKGLDLKAGHFYETLGRGILFRGYEIKNSVYEDQIYRVKQGFYRDAAGFAGSYSNKFLLIKGLRGRSLINQLPPDAPDNRLDLVTAFELNGKIAGQTLGIIGLQDETETKTSKYISILAGGNLFNYFDYYGEFAHRVNPGERFLSLNNNNSYGAYFNLGFSITGFGVSFELKDYKNIFIGSGISDPPSLVKNIFTSY